MPVPLLVFVLATLAIVWRLMRVVNKQTDGLQEGSVTSPDGSSRVSKPRRASKARRTLTRAIRTDLKGDSNIRLRGRIVWFNGTKGYGFIRQRNTKKDDIFFHFSDIDKDIPRDIKGCLKLGRKVEFEIKNTGKGAVAKQVRLMKYNNGKNARQHEGNCEGRLQSLNCIKIADGDGCVTFDEFKLSIHLFESFIDGEVELSEIYECIGCRCPNNDQWSLQ